MSILVTGGAGYIGSHTVVELLNNGYEVVVFDNFSNAETDVPDRIKQITNKDFKFYEIDVCDYNNVNMAFEENNITGVIHFAALKAVGESVEKPIKYYENNLCSTISLLKAMERYNVHNFVFSSSATVYGEPACLPITEEFELKPANPYGMTKVMCEQILKDAHKASPKLNVALLRYFNPLGAHNSGLLGEKPKGVPNNILPYISKVAAGEFPYLNVFGNDYNTKDGTGVRDYIHVTDLARGHIAALEKLSEDPGVVTYNLGTGRGYSVLELVEAFEKASGRKVPYQVTGRREGDIAACYASCAKAEKEMGFAAKLGIGEMCESAWKWQCAGKTENQ